VGREEMSWVWGQLAVRKDSIEVWMGGSRGHGSHDAIFSIDRVQTSWYRYPQREQGGRERSIDGHPFVLGVRSNR
jgi:hypothetical protein